MIIINLKNYLDRRGVEAIIKKVEKILPDAIVCVPTIYLSDISRKTNANIYAQHIDPDLGNKSTGFVLPRFVKQEGVKGTLLNHSEHRLTKSDILKTAKGCKSANIKLVVCVKSLNEAKKIISQGVKPFAFAYEDPKLISTGNSIVEKNTKKVEEFAKAIKKEGIKALCGAGINSSEDIKKSAELGCHGVLIASSIANNKNPTKLLKKIREVLDENKKKSSN